MALAVAEGDVLDNETLVTMMNQTRILMSSVNLLHTTHDEAVLPADDSASKGQDYERKENLRVIAQRGALLYEIISSLHLLNPLYQFSLHHFTSIFKAVLNSPLTAATTTYSNGTDSPARIASLLVKLNQAVFSDVGKSLFVRHRKVFAFLLATRIQQQAGYISSSEWKAFISSYAAQVTFVAPSLTPPPQELEGLVSWDKVTDLDNLVSGLVHSFSSFPVQWKQFIEANEYVTNQASPPLPDGWDDRLTVFQRLLVLLVTCEHKVMPEIYDFINKQLGVQFNSPETLELDRALIASAPLTPIIIISPRRNGVDALANLSKFVHEQGKSDKFIPISLGDDAERLNQPATSSLLSQALTQGHWVFIHHIYRNPFWLINVENLLENASSPAVAAAAATLSTSILSSKATGNGNANYPGHSLHSDFRLWLHCVEHLDTVIPISLLQKGIKLTIEQPTTIRTILAQIYSRMDERLFGSASKKMAPLFRRLVFVLCFFHASVLVRNEYTEQSGGWGGKYQFSENDLALGIETIRSKIAECEERNEDITFTMLQYAIAEVIYGGHIATVWDMNGLREMLSDLLVPLAQDRRPAEEKFTLPALPTVYASPPDSALGLEAYLRTLPLYDSSLAVGLSENVSRVHLQQAARSFLSDLATLSSDSHLATLSSRNIVPTVPVYSEIRSTILELERHVPAENREAWTPTTSGNDDMLLIAAQQEYTILSSVLARVKTDLCLLVSVGAAGSAPLLLLRSELINNLVPTSWSHYLEVHPLASRITPVAWFAQVTARWSLFRNWLQSFKAPAQIPLDYFVFPKSVFSSIIYAFARKKSLALDNIVLAYDIFTSVYPSLPSSPEDGVVIAGLHMVGARWNDSRKVLEQTTSSDANQLSIAVSDC